MNPEFDLISYCLSFQKQILKELKYHQKQLGKRDIKLVKEDLTKKPYTVEHLLKGFHEFAEYNGKPIEIRLKEHPYDNTLNKSLTHYLSVYYCCLYTLWLDKVSSAETHHFESSFHKFLELTSYIPEILSNRIENTNEDLLSLFDGGTILSHSLDLAKANIESFEWQVRLNDQKRHKETQS